MKTAKIVDVRPTEDGMCYELWGLVDGGPPQKVLVNAARHNNWTKVSGAVGRELIGEGRKSVIWLSGAFNSFRSAVKEVK